VKRLDLLRALCAVVVGGLFIYAALPKIGGPGEFARIVYHYQLVGPSARLGYVPANVFAVTLPWVELVAGALLVTGLWRREAAVVTCGLLLMFLFGVSWALAHGIDIENCGCFSVKGAGRAPGLKLMAGDLAMLAAALWVALTPASPRPAAAETADAPGLPEPEDA
jgi:putative oxidoreductase